MTKKELNLLKRKMFDVLMENEEIKSKVKSCGRAIVYEISDYQNKAIMVVDNPKQINDNTISDRGLNADKAVAIKLFTVSSNHDIAF